ncbi:hypothetical protein P4S93_00985 [Aneurinibacillus thermoaerophilus]|uniref:Uncharacterized protein n=1 Tax=Aneurinibacillus thermoaerophilus TaxID=143495 RepID=A0A1G7ZEN2_ANETH|nr:MULTISPECIES: hypothetical protein [Aneurinibacillus]MED0757113.1 hypothetical protein [Aneurinibacillus thermoaerophilus]MED0759366.1 hypothetical protein [Aneurinibacillus thermoaerophilus]QYY41206.1 hypothetical protein K3F53_09565 [Aneurinibacillus thermoaerophilus]SDH06996.1 hypothetical protein SAMN04489735_101052 [Aneurinibacillus thermoaerophilus]
MKRKKGKQKKGEEIFSPQNLQLIGQVLATIGAVLQTIGYVQELEEENNKKNG